MKADARKLGVLLVGQGGAVASTAIAGIERIKAGGNDLSGLPLADMAMPGVADYRDLEFGGWDVTSDDLAQAAAIHGVLDRETMADLAPRLREHRPWPGVAMREWCPGIDGSHALGSTGHRDAVERLRADIRSFRESRDVDGVVMVNLASVERWCEADDAALASLQGFERALDEDHPAIGPAMLYAYAAIAEGVAYGNFTPSLAADVPALTQMAQERGVPVAGKDGKTGQTMMKTVLAPMLKARALHVDGWFSTNILGNRDGQALRDPGSLRAKQRTKSAVLDDILGYTVEDHLVDINYYRPRGDDKEAWDNIDVTGFLGRRMQIKINFLASDSTLAAPLVIELARMLDLAAQRREGGIQEQLGWFFKAPMTRGGRRPEHAFTRQQQALEAWLRD